MNRAHATRSTDKKYFTSAAKRIKKINVSPKLSRGGIRL